jgi:hypothetical protein
METLARRHNYIFSPVINFRVRNVSPVFLFSFYTDYSIERVLLTFGVLLRWAFIPISTRWRVGRLVNALVLFDTRKVSCVSRGALH